jgi:hypothetical protein
MVLICDKEGQELIFFHAPKCAGEAVNDFLEKHFDGARRYNGMLRDGRDVMHVTPDTCSDIFGTATNFIKGKSVGHKGTDICGQPSDVARRMARRLKTHYKFTIVRNPYDRVLSSFEQRLVKWYWKKWGKPAGVEHQERGMAETEFNSAMLVAFLRWLHKSVKNGRMGEGWDDPGNTHFLPACFFSHDANYEQQIDFVGRVECLDEDLGKVLRHFNKNAEKQTAKPTNTKAKHGTRGLMKHTPETIQLVNELYYKDFELFGYEMITPKSEWHAKIGKDPTPYAKLWLQKRADAAKGGAKHSDAQGSKEGGKEGEKEGEKEGGHKRKYADVDSSAQGNGAGGSSRGQRASVGTLADDDRGSASASRSEQPALSSFQRLLNQRVQWDLKPWDEFGGIGRRELDAVAGLDYRGMRIRIGAGGECSLLIDVMQSINRCIRIGASGECIPACSLLYQRNQYIAPKELHWHIRTYNLFSHLPLL